MPPKPSSCATNMRLVSKLTPASAPAPSGRSSVVVMQKLKRWRSRRNFQK